MTTFAFHIKWLYPLQQLRRYSSFDVQGRLQGFAFISYRTLAWMALSHEMG